MSTRIYLWRALFGEKPRILLENSDFTVFLPPYFQTGVVS